MKSKNGCTNEYYLRLWIWLINSEIKLIMLKFILHNVRPKGFYGKERTLKFNHIILKYFYGQTKNTYGDKIIVVL